MCLEVVDITPISIAVTSGSGSSADALALDRSLLNQLEQWGFLYVTSSDLQRGAAADTLAAAEAAGKQFFCQPLAVKMQALSKDRARRGYSPAMSENFYSLLLTSESTDISSNSGSNNNNTRSNDDVEKLRFGPLSAAATSPDDDYYTSKEGRVHFFANPFDAVTSALPYFREATEECYLLLERLSLLLLVAVERSLGLAAGHFVDCMERHTSILTYNYYGSSSSALQPNTPSSYGDGDDGKVYRIAEHTDVSMITLVYQSHLPPDQGGLEVLSSEGIWTLVPHIPGALVVNVGDCLQEWTGGRLRSTRHRVRTSGVGERLSIAFFVSPNYRAMVQVGGAACSYSAWRQGRVKRAVAKQQKKKKDTT